MSLELVPLSTFVLVTTFTPGPNNISSASMGMIHGYRRTVGYLAGIACGFFAVMLICALLSSVLLAVVPLAQRYLRWVGAVYILWLAYTILSSDHTFSHNEQMAVNGFAKGVLLQLLNPKVSVFGLTLYSTFLAPISGRPAALVLSAATLAACALSSISLWALAGSAIKSWLKNETFKRILNITLSLLLVYTAVELSGVLP